MFDDAWTNGIPNVHYERLADILMRSQYLLSLNTKIYKILSSFLRSLKNWDTRTPVYIRYGGRVELTLDNGTHLFVHLKDKKLIRNKKRWSQVFFIYDNNVLLKNHIIVCELR